MTPTPGGPTRFLALGSLLGVAVVILLIVLITQGGGTRPVTVARSVLPRAVHRTVEPRFPRPRPTGRLGPTRTRTGTARVSQGALAKRHSRRSQIYYKPLPPADGGGYFDPNCPNGTHWTMAAAACMPDYRP